MAFIFSFINAIIILITIINKLFYISSYECHSIFELPLILIFNVKKKLKINTMYLCIYLYVKIYMTVANANCVPLYNRINMYL